MLSKKLNIRLFPIDGTKARGMDVFFHQFLTLSLHEGERSAKKRPHTWIMYWHVISTQLHARSLAGQNSNMSGDNLKWRDVGEVIIRFQGSNTHYNDWRVVTARRLSMRILGNYFVHDLSSLIFDSVRIADISTSPGLISDRRVGRGVAFERRIEAIIYRQ